MKANLNQIKNEKLPTIVLNKKKIKEFMEIMHQDNYKKRADSILKDVQKKIKSIKGKENEKEKENLQKNNFFNIKILNEKKEEKKNNEAVCEKINNNEEIKEENFTIQSINLNFLRKSMASLILNNNQLFDIEDVLNFEKQNSYSKKFKY